MNRFQGESPEKSSGSLSVSNIKPTEDHFTFQSQAQSQQMSRTSFRVKTDKDDWDSHSEYRERIEREMKMKIQSLTKGFQIKIAREKETYELKEMKYQQQICYLKNQVKGLSQIHRKREKENSQSHCNICSNGQVVSHMKNMLEEIESNHRDCIVEKSTFNAKIIELQQKLSVIEQQLKNEEEKYKKLKDQHRRLKNDIDVNEREKRERERVFREQQRSAQVKQFQLEEEIKKQKDLQAKLQSEINKLHYQGSKMDIISESPQHPFGQRSKMDFYDERENKQFFEVRDQFNRQEMPMMGHSHSRGKELFKNPSSSHIQANWKTKMEESYAEYAEARKKYKKLDQRPLESVNLNRCGGNRFEENYSFRGGRYNYL